MGIFTLHEVESLMSREEIQEFGKRIKELRESRDWSQSDLEKESGVKTRTICLWESGKLKLGPRRSSVLRACKALEQSIAYVCPSLAKDNERLLHWLELRRSYENGCLFSTIEFCQRYWVRRTFFEYLRWQLWQCYKERKDFVGCFDIATLVHYAITSPVSDTKARFYAFNYFAMLFKIIEKFQLYSTEFQQEIFSITDTYLVALMTCDIGLLHYVHEWNFRCMRQHLS